jgi:hypothetical protein
MVNAPSCAQCGSPLRWFAEQNAWGCDRCRKMFPAQPAQMPQQPRQMAHQPQSAQRRSGMKLAIGGLVVVGGIVAIVVATSGKGHGSGALAPLESARDEMCACKDEACQRDVLAKVAAFQKSHEGGGLSPAEHDQASKLYGAMADCAQKISGGTPEPGADPMLQEMTALRDRTCACTTKACASAVTDDWDRWKKKYMSGFNALPGDVRRKALAIANAQKRCYDSLVGG